jgi:hypothetical protein
MPRMTVKIGPISTLGDDYLWGLDLAVMRVQAGLGSQFMARYPPNTPFRSETWVRTVGLFWAEVVGFADTDLTKYGSVVVMANRR